MDKQFVSVTSNVTPSRNPYEIRTYMRDYDEIGRPEWHTENCVYERDCKKSLQKTTRGKGLSLEDEIHKIHQRMPDIFLKPFKAKCKYEDYFTTCVVPRRTPEQLHLHKIMRENYHKVKHEMNQRVHNTRNLYSHHESLIELENPRFDINVGKGIVPEAASADCSRQFIYVAPKKLLDLKRLKSGIFVNETERPKFSHNDDIYNPRILQEQFDAQYLKNIDIIPCKDNESLWTWNVGLQKKESELDRIYIEASVRKFECNDLELAVYSIPEDLHKTFAADIIFGSSAIKPQLTPKTTQLRRPIEMACLYVAFVEGFRLNADFWTSETLDNIIEMAGNLIKESVRLKYTSENSDYDIIPQISKTQAALNIKPHFAGALKCEPNIYKALSIYFSKYNACILCSNKLYLLIWKRCRNLFNIYDPNGRTEKGTRDFENGRCALLSTHFVEHLVHFVVNISQANLEDEFKLYEIFLTSYGKNQDHLFKKTFKRTVRKQWAVVNESFAVVPGCNNGIFQPTTSTVDNPSMLISVMAILYSHIDEGNIWQPDQVDELIRLGTAYYKSLRRKLKLKASQHITILDLPDKYVLGTYKASLNKGPFMYTGTVTDFCKKFMDSLVASGVQELFSNNWEAALLQIDNSVLGIWRDKQLFYVYDPFRRGKAGQVLDPDDYRMQGAAILQIHATIESLLRILYESSLKIRRGGKLFIHAINVSCIKPIMDGKERKLRYPKLKLSSETYVQFVENQKIENDNNKNDKSGKFKRKPTKICSIETLDVKEARIEFNSYEIVEAVLEELVCDIVSNCPEDTMGRPKLYKSAARILLRSDKEYLENLKYMLQHDEDYENMEMSFRTERDQPTPIISLAEELQVPSNFLSLPDGTGIIFGVRNVDGINEEQFKLKGLLSSIISAVLTAKYKVSTWTNELVDYALESADQFGEDFQIYQYALGALLQKRIPKISLGESIYKINLEEIIKSDIQKSLRQTLIELLINFNRLMLICQRFCCLIVKRLNFLYMFCGFAVNSVGYRIQTTGPGCMMRFVELDPLLKRIQFGCNPLGCDILNYVVVPLSILDTTVEAKDRYKSWPGNIEEEMYSEALKEKTRVEDNKRSKIRFLNEELAKEDRRIRNFEGERVKGLVSKDSQVKNSEEITLQEMRSELNDDENFYEEERFEEECTEASKHDSDSETETIRNEENMFPRPIVYGYRMREMDMLYKIQGSKALHGRTDYIENESKPCLVAAALAILYAILKPLHEWTSHRVDQVIDSTLFISRKIENMSIVAEMTFESISVDDYSFDVSLKHYEPAGLTDKNMERKLERSLYHNKYIILQTANCSYAIIKNDYYDLFDPYPGMTLMNGGKKAQEHKPKYLKSIKRYRERNTASWVSFADLNSMMEYISERDTSNALKEQREYKFFVLEIMSFKKAPQGTFILQMLTGMDSCHEVNEQETAICAQTETIAWLDHCLPIWSRLNRKNAAGQYRGTAVSKLKNYDIEIAQRLWSLWGNLHPQAPVFDVTTRGKQYLTCCVLSLCAASIYRLVDWSPHLLDSIVINGDRYLEQTLQTIKCKDHQLTLEDLNVLCMLDTMKFNVRVEIIAYGMLYSRPNYNRMNLAEALIYFFTSFKFGVLQCFKKCLAIGFIPGHHGGYFMFDCQNRDNPLFCNGQGSSYILRTKHLQILLYCIVITLNIPYYNVQFTLHKVNVKLQNQE